MITVFTPAYNRAKLLPRLYESLQAQQFKDFEWLIVDDGSTDETESLVRSFQEKAFFPVRYCKKENGGKHTAFNFGVQRAKGEWFFCVDSDDILSDNSLRSLNDSLVNAHQSVSAVVGYKADFEGRLLCKELPLYHYARFYDLMSQGGGEYSIILNTDLLKKFPFHAIPGERFVTESVLYDRLDAEKLNIFAIDEVLTICEYQSDGLSSDLYSTMIRNPVGFQIYHLQRIDLVTSPGERIKHILRYHSFRRLSRNREYLYRGKYRALTALLAPLGPIGALYYKLKAKRGKT